MKDATEGPSARRLLLALLAVQVFFGGLAVAAKITLPHVPPLGLALARLLTAAVVLFALERALVRSKLPPLPDLARFAAFALLGVVLNQGLFLSGLARTTATNAVLLIATIPAFTLLVAVLARQERVNSGKLAGLALSFAGVALLVADVHITQATLVGDLMIVANALSYSIYLVWSRPALDRYDPLTVIAWVFLFGAVEMALVATPDLLGADWGGMDGRAWTAFAYVLLLGTIFTYGVNNWVLRHTTASHVAGFVYLQPLVGAALGIALLDEPLTWRVLASGALIVGGVVLASRLAPSRRAAKGV